MYPSRNDPAIFRTLSDVIRTGRNLVLGLTGYVIFLARSISSAIVCRTDARPQKQYYRNGCILYGSNRNSRTSIRIYSRKFLLLFLVVVRPRAHIIHTHTRACAIYIYIRQGTSYTVIYEVKNGINTFLDEKPTPRRFLRYTL